MKKSLIITAFACAAALFLTSCGSVPTEEKSNIENEKVTTTPSVEETKEEVTDDKEILPAEEGKTTEAKEEVITNKVDTTENEYVEEIHSDDEVILVVDDEPSIDIDGFLLSLNNVNLSWISKPNYVTVHNDFVRPFTFVVKDNNNNPLTSFKITVKYPAKKVGGEIIFATEDLLTDENGKVSYTAKAPDFSALSEFTAYPTPIIDDIDVLNACEEKKISTPWKVKSELVNKPQLLFVWNYKISGNPDVQSREIINALKAEGINVGNAPFSGDPAYFDGPVKTAWQDTYDLVGSDHGYMIYGTIKYIEGPHPNDEGNYECSLIADIQAIKMKDGTVPFHRTFTQDGYGNGWNDCDLNAKQNIAQQIVNALLYDL